MRLVRNEEVRGSIPLGSTTTSPDTVATICLLPEALPDEFGATRPPTRPPVGAGSGRRAAGGGDFPQPAGKGEGGRPPVRQTHGSAGQDSGDGLSRYVQR